MPRKIVIPVTVDSAGVKAGMNKVKNYLQRSSAEISRVTASAGVTGKESMQAGINKTISSVDKLKDKLVSMYEGINPKAKAARAQLKKLQLVYDDEERKLKELKALKDKIDSGDTSLLKINSAATKAELKDLDVVIKATQKELDKVTAKADKIKSSKYSTHEVDVVTGTRTEWSSKTAQQEYEYNLKKSAEADEEYAKKYAFVSEKIEKHQRAVLENQKVMMQNKILEDKGEDTLPLPYTSRQIGALKGAATKAINMNKEVMASLAEKRDAYQRTAAAIREASAQTVTATEKQEVGQWIGGADTEASYNNMLSRVEELKVKLAELQAQKEAVLNRGVTKSKDATLEKLDAQINKVINDLQILGINIDKAKEKVKDADKAGQSSLDKFLTRVKNLAKRVFIFTVITRMFRSMRDTFSALVSENEEYQKTLADLKASLWTAFTPIYEVVVPALITMMKWLTYCINVMIKFYTLLTGKSLDDLRKRAKALQDTAKGAKKAAKDARDANKTLLGIDEVNRLDKEKEPTGSGGVNGYDPWDSSGLIGSITEAVLRVAAIIGGALVALGVMLIFMKQIPLGIGFIIAGAALEFGVVAAALTSEDIPIETKIKAVKGVITTALAMAVIGVILLFMAPLVGKLIGLALIAAAAFAVWEIAHFTQDNETLKQTVTEACNDLLAIITPFVAILGVITMITGHIVMGLSLVVLGIALFVDNYVNDDNGVSLSDKTRNVLSGILEIIGDFLLPVGMFLLLFIPGARLLGFGLVVAGAMATFGSYAVTMDSEAIKNKVKGVFNDIKNFLIGPGQAAMGAVLLFNPLTFPLGLSMLYNGLRNTFSAYSIDEHPILAKVRSLANSIISVVERVFNRGLTMACNIPIIGPGLRALGLPRRVYIPRLAKGAVIPSNGEFLAVLGDQKHGKNLEAPESLIRQIMQEELTKGAKNGTIEVRVPVVLDGNVLFEAIAKVNNDKVKMTGSSPLLV